MIALTWIALSLLPKHDDHH